MRVSLTFKVKGCLFLAGAQAYCVETLEFLFDPDARSSIDTTSTCRRVKNYSGNYFITALR